MTLNIERCRGNNNNNRPSGRSDLTAVEIIFNNNKPSGKTDLTTVEIIYNNNDDDDEPTGKPNLTSVEIIYNRWMKPTSRHRGKPSAL